MKIFAAFLVVVLASTTSFAADRPSVLVILADDLGFSDLGCYGGEIETPNLDALAANGLRYSQFYNTARCWPTRAALLTGYYAQQVRRDVLPGIKRGNRPDWAPLLSRRLKKSGYRTYHSGKWHIDGMPVANGFDRSYYLKDQGRFFNPQVHHRDDVRLLPIKADSDFYATRAIADHAIECLKEHETEHGKKPFFHYLAFTAPHFPLHALPEDIAKYRERYVEGWEVTRAKRWGRLQKLGVLKAELSDVERDLGPPYHFPEALEILGDGEVNRPLPWSSLNAKQRKFQAMKMALHAAMIDRMDQEIGRVVEQLRAMKSFDNTLIVFLSDNGASAEIMVRSDGHDPQAAPGSAKSYLCLGPGWSTVSNTPFRRHKTWVHEGGISTPFIAHWPAGIRDRGKWRSEVAHVIDIVPTVLELAGVSEAIQPRTAFPGRTLTGTFASGGERKPSISARDIWWSHEGHRAFRSGDWKIVASKGQPWELYDLSRDRHESRNLAELHPENVREMTRKWEERAKSFLDALTR